MWEAFVDNSERVQSGYIGTTTLLRAKARLNLTRRQTMWTAFEIAEYADQPTGVQCMPIENRLYDILLREFLATSIPWYMCFDSCTLESFAYFGVFCISAFH